MGRTGEPVISSGKGRTKCEAERFHSTMDYKILSIIGRQAKIPDLRLYYFPWRISIHRIASESLTLLK